VLLDLELEVIDASLLGGVTDDGGAHTELIELFLIHLGAMWRPTIEVSSLMSLMVTRLIIIATFS